MNAPGRVELWCPGFLPIGAAHLTQPGIASTASALSIPFAPALVRFEHRGGVSVPITTGIVVSEMNQGMTLVVLCTIQTFRW